MTLNGSGSTDADGNTLTYTWSFTSTPGGSTAALSNATVSNPTFTADMDGAYVLTLVVNDGTVDSVADAVTITAATAPESNTGALDTAFNGTGYVVHSNAAGGIFNDSGKGVAVDSSGKIVVAGYSTAPGGDYDMAIWRYNADGTLDDTFNSMGYVTHNNAAGGDGGDFGNAMALDSSGKIVVAGYSDRGTSNYDMVVWRYNTDGTLDTTFNGTGYAVHAGAAGGTNDYDEGYSITIDSSGKILVAGLSSNAAGNYDMAVWRYNTNGTLDTTFNNTGYANHDAAAGGGNDEGYAITLDSSGRIVVAGGSEDGEAEPYYDMAVWRFE